MMAANIAQSLRRVIFTRWSLLILGAMLALVGAFVLLGIRPIMERIAEEQFNLADRRVTTNLDALFAPAPPQLRIALDWLRGEPPDSDDPNHFNNQFIPVLRALPQITSVVAGNAHGRAWLLLAKADGGWRNRMTDIPRWGTRHLLIDQDARGRIKREWRDIDYDARKRPWYRAATTVTGHPDQVHWTAPYIFFTTGDPGITASIRATQNDGQDFVLGFDLMLRDVTRTTLDARVGKHGLAMVVTDDWHVLTLPTKPTGIEDAAWLARVLKPSADLGLKPVDAMRAAWLAQDKPKGVFRFKADDATWLASVRPYQLGEQQFLVTSLAPFSDFIPEWRPMAAALAGMLALVLLAALLVTRAQARAIAVPLENLARASKRIGALIFSDPQPVHSGIREISQLATAQETMRALLRDNQDTLKRQADDLRDQVEALRAAEARLTESEAYNKVLFADSRIPLVVLDPETGCFIDGNQAAVDIYHLNDKAALYGLTPDDVSAPRQYDGRSSDEAGRDFIRQALNHGEAVFEWRHRRADGSEWDAEVHLMAFRHGDHTLMQFSLQDITERNNVRDKLQQLAFNDTLTGLPNRSLLMDRLRQALATAQRHDLKVALLFLDLDRFKEINDTQGHSIGDKLLQGVAKRFHSVLRLEETMARMGGDEFVVLAQGTDQIGAALIAERLLGALSTPLEIDGDGYPVGVSIGIVLFPMDGRTPDELMQHADVAMYRAKSAGGGYRFYRPEMSEGLAERMILARDLKAALARNSGQLELHYQPQFDLHNHRLVGAEALMRWQHPRQGPISPGVFIPIAEERGMMAELGAWVLEEACRQLNTWRAEGYLLPKHMAINIATQQIESIDFPEEAAQIIRRAGLSPEQFELELTESGLMRNVEMAINVAGRLRAMGFSLSIDDFGTGYSSLAYLKRLPVGKVKIDMSFVRDMLDDHNDYAIVSTIIAMGRTLDMKTLAEGVEIPAQAETLLAMGCYMAQGFLFGRPERASVFAKLWLGREAAEITPANADRVP
jgi:diguanylate cyclase (GGDEF)-like protein/PAS domain S-box-containing protein